MKNKKRKDRVLKVLIFFNILTQSVFPIVTAFTSTIVAAKSNRQFIKTADPVSVESKTYILAEGETPSSVAKKYNISLDNLRKMNPPRPLTRDFDHLQAGDELFVPNSSLQKLHWQSWSSSESGANPNINQNWDKQIAGYASQLGNAMSQEDKGDAAASVARGMLSSTANAEIQRWLSRFGHSRIQLDTDKNFSFKNSQFDMLAPLSEKKDSLLFTQGSLHRTDGRTQINLGLGYRWFTLDWMLGSNSFLDYDLSRKHTRFGLGGEYWRDFLKLSMNTYFALSNWKNAPNFEDYQERPASGWDIRAQYWLRSLPQLGGKLTYEKYYGDEVALFDQQQRQKNPHAITAGLNYTPMPLVTFSVEHRLGQAGKSDNRFGVNINYQLGLPWHQQLDPGSVSALRSLAGSRYDLVERNNNIVLDYRKKTVISLATVNLVRGYANEQRSLEVRVTSKYGLDRINWSAASLFAAGGKIVQNGADWSIVLPPFQSSAPALNSYKISAVAVDKKGNISNPSATEITVVQAAIDATKSTISPASIRLPADGVSQQELVLQVQDSNGHPVDIRDTELSVEKSGQLKSGRSNIKFSTFKRRAPGEYVMTVTSGTVIGKFTLTPTARNTRFGAVEVTIAVDEASTLINSLTVVKNNAIANGQSQNRFKVEVVDGQKNPTAGQLIYLTADQGAKVPESVTTLDDGTITVPVTSKHAGQTTLTANLKGKATKTVTLNFLPDNSSAVVQGSINISKTTATVGDSVTYTAQLQDVHGNPLGAGTMVTWSANEGSMLSAQTSRTDDSGRASVTLTRKRVGIANVSLILPSGTTSAADVAFIAAELDEHNSQLMLTPSVIRAGKDEALLSLTLRDTYDNPLTGKVVSVQSDNSNVKIGAIKEDNHAQGYYSVTVSSAKIGSATLSVKVQDQTLSKSAVLTVVGDTGNWKMKEITSDKTSLVAGDSQGVTYRAKVTDSNDNPLKNIVVSWHLTGQAENYQPTTRTDDQGIAVTTVKSHTSGLLQMTAYLDANNYLAAKNVNVVAAEIKNATFSADKTKIGSDGNDSVTLTLSLEDSYGNPVVGKTLTIQGADSLPGFTLGPVQDLNNGQYKVTGSATGKGQVTLSAVVEGKKVGNEVKITVGALTPDLRFKNADQQVTWTKNFSASQAVNGLPDGVTQVWSSSDSNVATVDNTGKLTLLKSGVTIISVYTLENAQYNSAVASYHLKVNKADPGLEAGSGKPITAEWGDGINQNIIASYSNEDAKDQLTPIYTSQDPTVVRVDASGNLTAVKPGITTVSLSTPETDQFNAAAVKLTYVLDKSTAKVSFATTEEKTNDETTFKLQSPVIPLTPEASFEWTSSNINVVDVSESGTVKSVNKGQTRLTLSVRANDYYNASSGYYDVKIYSKPVVSLGELSYISKGTKNNPRTTWTPVFKDDTLSVDWSSDLSDEFSKPKSATLYIKNANNVILTAQEYISLEHIQRSTIEPNPAMWGNTIRVILVAKGENGMETTLESKPISVSNLEPKDIWTSFTIKSYSSIYTKSGEDNSCQETILGVNHWVRGVVDGDAVNFSGHQLISPMVMTYKFIATQNKQPNNTHDEAYQTTVNTDQKIPEFNEGQIGSLCWTDHVGGYSLRVTIGYSGKQYIYYTPSHGWGGNGDGNKEIRVDNL